MRTWTHYRARVASLSRDRSPNDPELIEARQCMQAARVVDRVRDALESDLGLTPEQRVEILRAVTAATT